MMCRVTKIHITLHKKELTAGKNGKVISINLEWHNAYTFKVIYFKMYFATIFSQNQVKIVFNLSF